MRRKPALALAAVTSLIGAALVVTTAALTGASVFGFHVGTARPTALADGPAPTRPSTSVEAVGSLPPVVVVQTQYIDQLVTVTRPEAPVPATVAARESPPTAGPVPPPSPTSGSSPVQAPTAVSAAASTSSTPTQPATTPATVPVTAPTTTATIAGRVSTTTTSFNPAAYPFNVTIPTDWGSKPVPAIPSPAPGRQWKQCELHDRGSWECQY